MHWTYQTFGPDEDLEQGDLISPTPELRDVLREVHPYFCDGKYLAFMVATQSCDLVMRKGGSKAGYISIAAVRSLRSVLPDLLAEVATRVSPGVFLSSTKIEARRFLARLFDQNEQGLGLFYLHRDAEVGFGESAVAFLRVKVALKSKHYGLLRQARTGRLAPAFQAKFGWLLGNLYGRAASPDWTDQENGKGEVAALIDKHVEEQDPGRGPKWVDDALFHAGKKANVVLEGKTHEEALLELEKFRPTPTREQLALAATELLHTMLTAPPGRGGPAQAAGHVPDAIAEDTPSVPRVVMTHADIEEFAVKFGRRLSIQSKVSKLLK